MLRRPHSAYQWRAARVFHTTSSAQITKPPFPLSHQNGRKSHPAAINTLPVQFTVSPPPPLLLLLPLQLQLCKSPSPSISISMLLKCLSPHSTVLLNNPKFPAFTDNTPLGRPHGDCLAFSCSRRWNPRVWAFNGGDKRRFGSFYGDEDDKRDWGLEDEEQVQGRGVGVREVHCEVEVVSWRERRIRAEISVNADVDSVWDVLTDYERLADFIPNLVCSRRIPCPHPGRIWLEQRGLQRALYWHIEARVVLDLLEFSTSLKDRELRFSMVDGDFKKFEGKWSIKSDTRSLPTTLSYEVNVIPQFNLPTIFLERIILSDLPVNLRALAYRAESNFQGDQKLPNTEPSTTGSVLDVSSDGPEVAFEDGKHAAGELRKTFTSSGSAAVPQTAHSNSNWGVFGKVCRLDNPCLVDEIHLRRFDDLLESGGVHRSVAASITVKAPVLEVWNVLTAYETLPEIVPNLAISKVLLRDNNKVRILQEGCKGLLYMVLHARVVMDLCEHREQDITFEQVEGDFDSFQGKWQFEQLGNHHTLLKYYVESKMRKDTFLSDSLVEEVIYEDLPTNLCAIRDYIEKRIETISFEIHDHDMPTATSSGKNTSDHQKQAEQGSDFKLSRRRVPGLQHDIGVLRSELLKFISEHGQEGFMPMRKQLRLHGRMDIEKAINRMGGFRKIASLMNLSLAYKNRKPKGYWDDLENLHEEIKRFQKNWGMDPSFMPSRKTFERAGRYDLARALEKWGGLHEVSRLLYLKVRQSGKGNLGRDENTDHNITASHDAKVASRPHVSQDTSKWLTKLDNFDIDWAG